MSRANEGEGDRFMFVGRYSISKKQLIIMVIMLMAVMTVIIGCEAEKAEVEETMEDDVAREEPVAEEQAEAEADGELYGETAEKRESLAEQDRIKQKLILNGRLDILVDDAEETRSEVEGYMDEVGGYIENSSFSTYDEGIVAGNITARVPGDYFHEAMDYLEDLGEVESRQTSSDDVTMEYIDLDARLNNLERQEERYLEILEKAEEIEEVISVEEKLSEVREDIETLTARLERLEAQVNYSTIEISIEEKEPVEARVDAAGFDGLMGRMFAAFTGSIDNVINGVTGLAVFLSGSIPYLVIMGIIGVAAYRIRYILRIRKDKSQDENII